jgi:hypothetical protein
MEAKSGQWIRNIYVKSILCIGFEWNMYLPARLSSKFMVIATESRREPSKFLIYDLEAIRNPSSKERILTTITVKYCLNDDQ